MTTGSAHDDTLLEQLHAAQAQAWKLRFPDSIERDFRRQYDEKSLAFVRRTLPWLTLMYVLVLVAILVGVDNADADRWRNQALLPGGGSLLVLWLALPFRRLDRHIGLLAGIAMLGALAIMTRGVFLVDQTALGRPVSYCVVYVLLIIFALARQRLRQALAATATAFALVLLSTGIERLQPDWLAFAFYFPMTAVLCAVVGYMIEHGERTAYIGTRILAIEKQRLEAMQESAARDAHRRQLLGEYLELVSGNPTATEIAGRSLKFLVDAVGAQVGVAYLVEGTRLRRAADWALAGESSSPYDLGRGETVIGQAVANARPQRLRHLPPDYHRISTGVGSASPAELLIEPVVHAHDVLAVIELGKLTPFSDDDIALAERICRAMAGVLVAANARDALARARLDEFTI